jgi:hypothetical protein
LRRFPKELVAKPHSKAHVAHVGLKNELENFLRSASLVAKLRDGGAAFWDGRPSCRSLSLMCAGAAVVVIGYEPIVPRHGIVKARTR